jgi:hypothetical protein
MRLSVYLGEASECAELYPDITDTSLVFHQSRRLVIRMFLPARSTLSFTEYARRDHGHGQVE